MPEQRPGMLSRPSAPGRPLAGTRSIRVLISVLAITAVASIAVLIAGSRFDHPVLRLLRLPAGLTIASAALGAITLLLAGWPSRSRRSDDSADRQPRRPDELDRAAEIQARRTEDLIQQVEDPARREGLRADLARLDAERKKPPTEFHVVVFGTGSAGKTSLINALLGRQVGETEPVMGTTRHGETHTYELKGVEGTVFLTDTPGLSEAGSEGPGREQEARALAVQADLLLFVVDHDLIRTEYERLVQLAHLGKHAMVVLNKKDRFPDEDLNAILARLRERLAGLIAREDIVAVAAAPRPTPVRIQRADGSTELVYEPDEPDLTSLRARVAELLRREGHVLHAANLLVRTKVLGLQAQEQLEHQRESQAEDVIERFQWVAAGAVFANPIPVFELVAGGAVQVEMVGELARVYGIKPSPGHDRMLGGLLVKTILKLGLVEAATSLVAGIFKKTLVGFAAGGAVQAVTMAYLTRVSGRALSAYFRDGESWGPGGVEGAVLQQFELNSRAEFLQQFARQAVDRVIQRVRTGSPARPSSETLSP